ncbi:hypothetical protein G6L15_08365 [Agrobacterium rhizogenes]|uniref:DUF7666 domain-containing protein n=1 Tax=Rhizobium rhizogenes TaxID=359 RepID=UPI0015729ED0|nr:hypothetical protein [Rhizobium rhizogenes]NTG86158.1 hypothetical protein [Rhizobium rhizogenes]
MAKKPKQAEEVVTAEQPTVFAIKGFDTGLKCRGYQFEVGRTEKHEGKVEACEGGFHAIIGHPLSVFKYYAPGLSVYHRVELSGSMHTDDDEKTAAEILKVGAQIGMSDLVKEAVKWVTDRATVEEGGSATGYQGAASATGDQGAASATGTRGAASATGTRGAASATGYQGAASATGDQGAASATGDQGAASATGTRGAASATGYQGAASATGDQGAAMSSGFEGKVSGVEGNALFLVERHEWDGPVIAVWAGIAGKDGIKPNTFYTLRGGQPVEVAP